MNEIQIPISPGELLDKITILQIKAERIGDPVKVANVKTELDMLSKIWNETVEADAEITALTAELKSINEALWEIEDDIRDEERNSRFGERFIELARAMYYTSVTVVLGFSILALSNFIPTIYFGILSGLAMITALIANLMLLPILIARFRLS